MKVPRRQQAATPAQWPVVAALWSIHGVSLFHLFFANFISEKAPLSQVVATATGILGLLVLELGLLALLASGLDLLAGGRHRLQIASDALKSGGLCLLLAVLVASVLKFRTSSVHLKLSDLWFAYANFRQLAAEAALRDVARLIALPLLTLVATAATYLLLRQRRLGNSRTAVASLLLPLALGGAGVALATGTSPVFRQFARDFAPETYWLARLATPTDHGLASAAAAGGHQMEAYVAETAARPYNVLLIMLESVPWKRTPFATGDPRLAPNLVRLARESVVFSRAYATSAHSDYAQMSLLSSLHPRKYKRHDYYIRIEYPRTLIWDPLKKAGYTTGMFSCQNERWGNMLNYLNTPGLDVLRHSPDWPRAEHRGRGADSKVYEETPVDEWMRWRKRQGDAPNFTYLNFQATHFPYEAPAASPRPFAPHELDPAASYFSYPTEQVDAMLNRFHNALYYTDAQIGRVLDFLEERRELDRTVVIVASDHGEAFYEHDHPTHGAALYEEQVRSLLMMRIPGEAPRVVDSPISMLDVAPTLFEVLGLPPHGNFQGRGDILGQAYSGARRPIFFSIQGMTAEDGLLFDNKKYVVNWDRRQRALFDLGSDPEERTNLVETTPEDEALAARILNEFLAGQLDYYERKGWQAGYYPPRLP